MVMIKITWTSLYYVGFILGLFLVATNLWVIIDTIPVNYTVHFILFMSGIGMVISTLLIVNSSSRSGRLLLTIASGSLAGVHGFLDVVYFPTLPGYFMFMWLAFGTLLTLSCYDWLARKPSA